MNIGTRVRFSRPGSMRSQIEWSGVITGCSESNYTIKDESGKLRVVPVNAKWLTSEDVYGRAETERKIETKNPRYPVKPEN